MYYKRVLDNVLNEQLKTCGAVEIVGAKWCGKSTTAMQQSNSSVFLQDQKTQMQVRQVFENAPEVLLDGSTPRLIDEWQTLPSIWDQVRFEVDKRQKFGQFILTGSATPVDFSNYAAYHHSGVGRIVPVKMRPMSLFESKDSAGKVSLNGLFSGKFSACSIEKKLNDYAFLIARGGWPASVGKTKKVALAQAKNFYIGLVENDINTVFQSSKNPQRINRFLRTYARAISSEMALSKMKDDMAQNEGQAFDTQTIASYIAALERLFVAEEMQAWNPNLRSRAAARTKPTHHFVDPSIACAALGASPNDLMADFETFGLLFENMCVRDLRIYSQPLSGEVLHYRDSSGLEADAVIHLQNGNWAACEVKLRSESGIEQGAKNLLKLAENVKMNVKPSFLAVITATNYAYRRKDGVYVVPIGCLGP